MGKNRLEAFSDGVLAIIITIMVLELKVPNGVQLAALIPLLPVFLSYVLSFIYLGIYWNNHHHMLYTTKHVGGGILWANLHFAFLAFALSYYNGMDGRESFRPHTNCSLWVRSANGRSCIFTSYNAPLLPNKVHNPCWPLLSAVIGRGSSLRCFISSQSHWLS